MATSKDIVLRTNPDAKLKVSERKTVSARSRASKIIKTFNVVDNGIMLGFGKTESEAWTDAKNWLKRERAEQ